MIYGGPIWRARTASKTVGILARSETRDIPSWTRALRQLTTPLPPPTMLAQSRGNPSAGLGHSQSGGASESGTRPQTLCGEALNLTNIFNA